MLLYKQQLIRSGIFFSSNVEFCSGHLILQPSSNPLASPDRFIFLGFIKLTMIMYVMSLLTKHPADVCINVQFAAKICLLTSFRDTCFIEIMPQYQAPKRGEFKVESSLHSRGVLKCLKEGERF